jgi:Na+-translocating ferredoxin:NAD+ oxidoreductase RNF subunit RnfB
MIAFSIITVAALGAIFGIGLTLASKKFAVVEDPRIEKLVSVLPGSNCGACGFIGCHALAQAIIQGKADVSSCIVGGVEVANRIAEAMGEMRLTRTKREIMVAALFCYGGINAKDRMQYHGIKDCRAAMVVLGGQKQCTYACLGFGSCMRACPFDAITMSKEFLPVIDADKCTACQKCIKICPKGVLHLVSKDKNVKVRCSSHDKGNVVVRVCSVGCIACKKCEETCRFDAIHVIDNLAVIDYKKCTECLDCVKVCPRHIISYDIDVNNAA